MTKIGIYAIFRFNSLLFSGSDGVTADITSPWLLPVAMLTLVLGGLGALAARRLLELIAYLTVASVGMILVAYSIGNPASFSGALFYMVHSTLISAALFLLAEMIGQARGSIEDKLQTGPLIKQGVALGITFLIAGAIAIGLPLSSGFLAKLMILQSATLNPYMPMIWILILLASFIGLIGLSRAGSTLFWKTSHEYAADARLPSFGQWLPILFLLGASLLMVIYAAPLKQITDQTAAQMKAPNQYIEAVIGQTADRAPRALPRESRP